MLELEAPDLEDLAAYIDGRLSGEKKTQVEERLLRDEDYYEVFMETSRFQQEERRSDESGESKVVRWRLWRKLGPLSVAAGLILAASLLLLRNYPTRDWVVDLAEDTGVAGDIVRLAARIGLLRLDVTEGWIAALDAAAITARERWSDPGWTRLRSSNVQAGWYGPEELAFRLGLRTVDLRVALAAHDRGAVTQLASVLYEYADAANQFVAVAAYGDLRDRAGSADFDKTGDVEELRELAETAEKLLEESYAEGPEDEARSFRLSRWTEAGRLAALSGNARVLSLVIRDAGDAASVPEIAEELDRLEKLLAKREPDQEDFDAAAADFSRIAKALAG